MQPDTSRALGKGVNRLWHMWLWSFGFMTRLSDQTGAALTAGEWLETSKKGKFG